MSGDCPKGLTGLLVSSTKDVLTSRYQVTRNIGRGSFGLVKLAFHRDTGTDVAVKVLKKGTFNASIKSEVSILKTLQHPNIARLIEVKETVERVYLILEYASRGTLLRYVRKSHHLQETQAREFFRQICWGLAYCHQQGVAHLDIKPNNILLDSTYTIKICDFGMSTRFTVGEQLCQAGGAWSHRAPEMFLYCKYHGPKADAWSLGVVLYFMTVGGFPFQGRNFQELRKNILCAKYHLPRRVSAELKNILGRLLTRDSSQRATVEEILEHAWAHQDAPSPPVQTLAASLNPAILSAMVAIGYDAREIVRSLQNREINDTTAMYLLFEQRARQDSNCPMELDSIQPVVPPCPSPASLSTRPETLRRRASAPASLSSFSFSILTWKLNLPQNDHNSGKNGSKRIFLTTSPLFTPQRRSPNASRVPPHACVELKGGKSSEHKCSAQNALPVGQPQEVIRGAERNRSRGWRGAARRIVTTLLRMCCFPSCSNVCHRGGQADGNGEQEDLTTALRRGIPPRCGLK
ncbi:sperm motility kinase 2B-like [Castor canadensis]|uniref:Sperm motility kinase 2B-like n=1 Tax=Castor canadensis TaxID=51338 RepID=A0AC58LES2_CASCN